MSSLSKLSSKPSVPFSKDTALWKEPESLNPLSVIPNTLRPINESAVYLKKELNIERPDSLYKFIWLAGLTFLHVRPLHRQLVVRRTIKICEQMDLHLVLNHDDIFVKPIPKCLLHYAFFEEYVATDPDLCCTALGFLSTYLYLIRSESDLDIALDLKLVPASTTWDAWMRFTEQVRAAIPPRFGNRFDYGELKLARLNIVAGIFRGDLVRGYQNLETSYGARFTPFFAVVALLFAFVSVALAAFQTVFIAPTKDTKGSTGYWFSVVTLVMLVAISITTMIWFIVLLSHSISTGLRARRRTGIIALQHLGTY